MFSRTPFVAVIMTGIEFLQALLSYAIKCCKPSADLDDKRQDYNKMMAEFRQRFGNDINFDVDQLLDSFASKAVPKSSDTLKKSKIGQVIHV